MYAAAQASDVVSNPWLLGNEWVPILLKCGFSSDPKLLLTLHDVRQSLWLKQLSASVASALRKRDVRQSLWLKQLSFNSKRYKEHYI